MWLGIFWHFFRSVSQSPYLSLPISSFISLCLSILSLFQPCLSPMWPGRECLAFFSSVSLCLPLYISVPSLFFSLSPLFLPYPGAYSREPSPLCLSPSLPLSLSVFPFYLPVCGQTNSLCHLHSVSICFRSIFLCLPYPVAWQRVPSPLCVSLSPLYLSLSPLPSSLAESAFSPLCLSVSTLSFSVSPTQWPGRECLLPSVSLCLHSIFLCLPYPVAWQRVRRLSGLYLWGGSTSSGTASKVITEANNTNQINIYIKARR